MKKILVMLSLLVVAMFLVSCTPATEGDDDSALAGQALRRAVKLGVGQGPCKSSNDCVDNSLCFLRDKKAPNYKKCVAISTGYKNPAGGVCGSSVDCQEGLTCYIGDGPNNHKCVAISEGYKNPAGAPCGSNDHCQEGLVCYLDDPTAPNYHKCVASSPGQ